MRKAPQQARSRVTTDAILDSAARILGERGWTGLTTNGVAEVAGVSIGSLYQYFPSKEALVAAVIDRHNQHAMQVVRAALTQVGAQPIEQAVRKMVATAIEAHRIDPKLHRVLAEQLPRTGRLKQIEAFDREYYVLVRAYLEAHRDELRTVDLGLAAFVCVTAIEALSHTAVLHRSAMLSDEAVRTLVDECTRLVAGYLR